MHLIEYINLIYSIACICLPYLDLSYSIDLTVLEDIILKHLIQAKIEPVLLQKNAYLYFEELQNLYRKIKYNDSNAILKAKEIQNKGGPLFFNYSLNRGLLKENEWSNFEVLVLDDILNATKTVWNKCIVSIANLNNNTSISLEYDSFELRSDQKDNTPSQYQNSDVNNELLYYNDPLKEEKIKEEHLLHQIVSQKHCNEPNNQTFKIQMYYWKNGKKLPLEGEKIRQINVEKLKRQIKHKEMKTIANRKKTEKQRKHLERMKQRQMLKERKAKRMEKHRLLMKKLEKKQI